MDGTLTPKHSEIMKLIKRFQDKSSGKVGESRKRPDSKLPNATS